MQIKQSCLGPLLWVKSTSGEVKHSPSDLCIAGAILHKHTHRESLAKNGGVVLHIYICHRAYDRELKALYSVSLAAGWTKHSRPPTLTPMAAMH